jgi:DNA-binding HxlR family transcriptional regulator
VRETLLKKNKPDLAELLRKMSKKGYYETLSFICQKGSVHYAEILDYDLKTPIVESRATVTLIVRNLTALGLIKRSIVDSRPIRTVYQPTEKGQKLLEHLHAIEQL